MGKNKEFLPEEEEFSQKRYIGWEKIHLAAYLWYSCSTMKHLMLLFEAVKLKRTLPACIEKLTEQGVNLKYSWQTI